MTAQLAQDALSDLGPAELLLRAAVVAAAYVLVAFAGSRIVRAVLDRHALPAPGATPDATGDQATSRRMGHTIGVLERLLGLTFVLLDAWAGLAGIIAAKSIARFKDLEQRPFGEYFLVGTLTSLLVTVAVGAATLAALEFLPR